MYCLRKPPKPETHIRQGRSVIQTYDFSYDKKHNLIVVEAEKVNFDKLAHAAAEGCDFKTIHDTLRAGAVRLPRQVFESTPGKGVEYGDATTDPTSLIDIAQGAKAAAAKKAEADGEFAKLPADLTKGMTFEQFESLVPQGYLEKYVQQKAIEAQLKEGEKK